MSMIEVETTHGTLRGIREKGVNIFKGIPYAGSVSGARRFSVLVMPMPDVKHNDLAW